MAILSIIGFIIGVVGLVMTKKANGKTGYSVLSLVFNSIAFILVIVTQFIYLDLLYDYYDGPQAISAETPVVELSLGQTAHLQNGLDVTVDDLRHGISGDSFDGQLISVNVTIENKSSDNRTFGSNDWEAISKNGVISNSVFISQSNNRLDYGTFLTGGKVSGGMYFKNDTVQIAYVTGHDKRIAATWDIE